MSALSDRPAFLCQRCKVNAADPRWGEYCDACSEVLTRDAPPLKPSPGEGTPFYVGPKTGTRFERKGVGEVAGGCRTRTVLKTPETIRLNRSVIMSVFGCPDDLVEETLAYALKHIDDE